MKTTFSKKEEEKKKEKKKGVIANLRGKKATVLSRTSA